MARKTAHLAALDALTSPGSETKVCAYKELAEDPERQEAIRRANLQAAAAGLL